ncbi:histidine decarboxylase-like isoform X1 [Archocentrus centrarchus]|uniref:histidine decarboxylase-like isoform X1 n=2 Tax=Archocentrus centrarchus TaxID=63155 RepID=UPI0011E9E259|nr:histidine decarboxylase-like isoform X1 [Archocentrus centrarchus]
MQGEEYNRRGKEMVDYITKYLGSIRERRVIPDVKPGYMRQLLPETAPTEPEDWENIFNDIEKVIMPGVVHWQSPHMHAYYPNLTSWPSMLGDMLADAINCIGFTWASSPACTELEMNVMDWLCKALELPSFFLHHHPDSRGGGILQSTVSESTLVALLAARKDKILQLRAELDQDVDDSVINSRLVAYASDQAHSSVEKAGLISLVKIRFLPTDEEFSLRGDTLKQAIEEDRARGLFPFLLCSTLGTTGVCAFDKLSELGPVCEEEGLWLHVDAAYAGSAYFCPELRWSLKGIEFAHSFVFNPSKWMMVHFDCTAFWVKDKYKLQQTFSVDPVYLRHENSQAATDFMHWQIPLSRRFRALKLWFVMRSFGLKNLQAHIRHGIEMAKLLESHIKSDPNFEVPAKRHLGLVVFCLKGGNALTQELLRRLTRSGTMYLIPADIHTKRIIRFTVTSQHTTADDILRDWSIISKTASTLLAERQTLNYADQPQSGEDDVIGDEEYQDSVFDTESDETEDDVARLEKAQVELWLDKAWDRSRRPMRSLRFNSEPLPYTYIAPQCGCDFETKSRVSIGGLPVPSTTGSGPTIKITEMPSNVLGKQVLKKLTKLYSVPRFCNQWVQCGRHQLCCPLKVSPAAQKHLSPTCRRVNCMSSKSCSQQSSPYYPTGNSHCT